MDKREYFSNALKRQLGGVRSKEVRKGKKAQRFISESDIRCLIR